MPSASNLLLKRSTSPGLVPSSGDLLIGELAANLTDSRLFSKDHNNDIIDLTGLREIEEDVNPILGGHLDANGYDIDNIGNLEVDNDIQYWGRLIGERFRIKDLSLSQPSSSSSWWRIGTSTNVRHSVAGILIVRTTSSTGNRNGGFVAAVSFNNSGDSSSKRFTILSASDQQAIQDVRVLHQDASWSQPQHIDFFVSATTANVTVQVAFLQTVSQTADEVLLDSPIQDVTVPSGWEEEHFDPQRESFFNPKILSNLEIGNNLTALGSSHSLARLNIQNAGGNSVVLENDGDDIRLRAGRHLTFDSGGSNERMRIASDGTVEVYDDLEVDGNVDVLGTIDSQATIRSTTRLIVSRNTSGDLHHANLDVTSAGNVRLQRRIGSGIGTDVTTVITLFDEEIDLSGNVRVLQGFEVQGESYLSGDLEVEGDSDLFGTLSIETSAFFGGSALDVLLTSGGNSSAGRFENTSGGAGSSTGIEGVVSNSGEFLYGVRGITTASAEEAYGIYGSVSGGLVGSSGSKYAIYGTAAGDGDLWAGYFADGDVFVENNLFVDGTLEADSINNDGNVNIGGSLDVNGSAIVGSLVAGGTIRTEQNYMRVDVRGLSGSAVRGFSIQDNNHDSAFILGGLVAAGDSNGQPSVFGLGSQYLSASFWSFHILRYRRIENDLRIGQPVLDEVLLNSNTRVSHNLEVQGTLESTDIENSGDVYISGDLDVDGFTAVNGINTYRSEDQITIGHGDAGPSSERWKIRYTNAHENWGLQFYDVSADDTRFFIGRQSNINEVHILPNTGNVGIGTSSPSAKLHVNGDVNLAGWTMTDDGIMTPPNWGLIEHMVVQKMQSDTTPLFSDWKNELVYWEYRGFDINVESSAGVSVSGVFRLNRPDLGSNNPLSIDHDSGGWVSLEFDGPGFDSWSSGGGRFPYIQMRTASQLNRISNIKIEVDNGTGGYFEVWNESNIENLNGMWIGDPKSWSEWGGGVPERIKYTFTFGTNSTNTRFVTIGFAHGNIPIGYEVLPFVGGNNIFHRENTFNADVLINTAEGSIAFGSDGIADWRNADAHFRNMASRSTWYADSNRISNGWGFRTHDDGGGYDWAFTLEHDGSGRFYGDLDVDGSLSIDGDIDLSGSMLLETALSAGEHALSVLVNSGTNTVAGRFENSGSSTSAPLIGVEGLATASSQFLYGVRGVASASSQASYGVYGAATGPSTANYGIYGVASGASQNFAGFFGSGDVRVQNDLIYGRARSTFSNASSLGSSHTFNFNNAQHFRGSLTENATLTISNLTDGQYGRISIDHSGQTYSITWAGIDKWDEGGLPPSPNSGQRLVVDLFNDGLSVLASWKLYYPPV